MIITCNIKYKLLYNQLNINSQKTYNGTLEQKTNKNSHI